MTYLIENLMETRIWDILDNQMLQNSVAATTSYVADDSWWDTCQAFAFMFERMHNHLANKHKEAAGDHGFSLKQFNPTETY